MQTFDVSAAQLTGMSQEELNRLPFGVLELDASGVIQQVNTVEADRTGRVPGDLVGRNFFGEIAPCTDVREFGGRFRDGVRSGSLKATFAYRFDLPGAPQDVFVHLACYRPGYGWVLISRHAG